MSVEDSGGDPGIVISSTITASNLSAGSAVIYAGQTAPDGAMQFNSLTAGTGGITMATAAGSVNINNTLTCANIGAGQGVFSNKLSNIMSLRSIKAGPGLVVTGSASEITVGADSNVTGVAAVNSVAPDGANQSWIGSTPAASPGPLSSHALRVSRSVGPERRVYLRLFVERKNTLRVRGYPARIIT
ncbi:MAG: hypothetical protein ACK528_14220, partial [Alphaproteobacteria bacterium]